MQIRLNTIKTKVITITLSGVVVLAIVLLAITLRQKWTMSKLLDADFEEAVRRETAATAKETYLLCRVQHEILQQQVVQSLSLASNLVRRAGSVHTLPETVTWTAVNQFTKQAEPVVLSKMLVGETWLEQNADRGKSSFIVDEAQIMSGSVCTIFQRMNERGDMLRVCTNVKKQDGTRAIGTFIPAVGTDLDAKAPNPIVQALLRGESYTGMAFVVDGWYIAAYQPLFDEARNLIGALFVGVPRDVAANLGKGIRKGITDIKVGKTGYVYVVGGKGAQRGTYIISKDGQRNGESIWDATDASGKPFIQAIVQKGLALKEGEIGYERYPWKNDGTGVKDANQRVAQISTVSQSVAQDIATVNQASREMASGSEQLLTSSTELSQLADGLQSVVSEFKLNPASDTQDLGRQRPMRQNSLSVRPDRSLQRPLSIEQT